MLDAEVEEREPTDGQASGTIIEVVTLCREKCQMQMSIAGLWQHPLQVALHQPCPRKPGFSCDGKVVISPQVPHGRMPYWGR